jgi:hypothetical protein
MWPGRGWIIGLVVSSIGSAGIGFWLGLRDATVQPPAPAAVCPMIRAETIYLTGHIGNLVVQVYYVAELVTGEALVRSATLVAREVLSRP